MWNVRNDFIFTEQKKSSFMSFIPLATNWIRTWPINGQARWARFWVHPAREGCTNIYSQGS
jgi:hypothetical protein